MNVHNDHFGTSRVIILVACTFFRQTAETLDICFVGIHSHYLCCCYVMIHTLCGVVVMGVMTVAVGVMMLMPILLLVVPMVMRIIPVAMVITMMMTVTHFGVMFTMVMFPTAWVMVVMVMFVISTAMMAVTRCTSVRVMMTAMLHGIKKHCILYNPGKHNFLGSFLYKSPLMCDIMIEPYILGHFVQRS